MSGLKGEGAVRKEGAQLGINPESPVSILKCCFVPLLREFNDIPQLGTK